MILTFNAVSQLAEKTAFSIEKFLGKEQPKIYGIPQGGISAALAVTTVMPTALLVDNPEEANVFIDDIIDGGKTNAAWFQRYPQVPFFALIDRTRADCPYPADLWVTFPWDEQDETTFSENIRRLIQLIGEDPDRDGLRDTPNRVAKAWAHWVQGYQQSPAEILTCFEDGAENYDELVLIRDIPFFSHCEHHLTPFFGTASIGYIPFGRIVGLSKLVRLLEIYACRLQVQERLTVQIADALNEHLSPIGVGVIIKARHLCIESRGITRQGHYTITSALRGVMQTKAEARAEFMELAKP